MNYLGQNRFFLSKVSVKQAFYSTPLGAYEEHTPDLHGIKGCNWHPNIGEYIGKCFDGNAGAIIRDSAISN